MGFLALADKFHRIDVDVMLTEVSSRQISEWFAFYKVRDVMKTSKQESRNILNKQKTGGDE